MQGRANETESIRPVPGTNPSRFAPQDPGSGDASVAATAMEAGLALVTRNVDDFAAMGTKTAALPLDDISLSFHQSILDRT